MFNNIRNSWRRRAGYQDATREIEDLCDGAYPDEQIFARRARTLNRRPRLLNEPYVVGWCARWIEFGASDARQGRCQSTRFDYHPYNLGWAEQVAERHKYGWRHPDLDRHFESLREGVQSE